MKAREKTEKQTAVVTLMEPAREIPVVGEYDVIVCGGGTSGCPAAIAAGREGVRVALLEKFSYLGGVPIHSLNPTWHGSNYVYQGLLEEMLREAYRRSGWDVDPFAEKALVVDPDILRQVLTEMVQEAGVEILLHTWIAGVIPDGDAGHYVITESKSGRQALRAKILIDGTGDADVAVALGADYHMGDPEDDFATQGMTVRFVAGNVDFPKYLDFLETHPELRRHRSSEEIQSILRKSGIDPTLQRGDYGKKKQSVYVHRPDLEKP